MTPSDAAGPDDIEAPLQGLNDERWRRLLTGEDPILIRGRDGFRRLPSPPRCKLCNVPFAGLGGAILRHVGFAPWPKNPRFCQACHRSLAKLAVGGAEVEISVVFADVRGSTSLAEAMRPLEFRALIDRFYRSASQAIIDADGIVDSFLGDGVLALFIPAWAGTAHARRAIDAAQGILVRTGNTGGHPWIPVGVGIHTGLAFVGIVSRSERTDAADDLTALGDTLNTAARLSSVAGAGEILISEAAAGAAGLDQEHVERRSLELKGKGAPVGVVVLNSRDDASAGGTQAVGG